MYPNDESKSDPVPNVDCQATGSAPSAASVELESATGSSIKWSTKPSEPQHEWLFPTASLTGRISDVLDDFQVTGDVHAHILHTQSRNADDLTNTKWAASDYAWIRRYSEVKADNFAVADKGDSVWTALEPNSYPRQPIERKPIRNPRTKLTTVMIDDKAHTPGPVAAYMQTLQEREIAEAICYAFYVTGYSWVLMRNVAEGSGRIEQLGTFAANDATYDALKSSCRNINSVMCRHDGKVGWYDIRTQVFTPVKLSTNEVADKWDAENKEWVRSALSGKVVQQEVPPQYAELGLQTGEEIIYDWRLVQQRVQPGQSICRVNGKYGIYDPRTEVITTFKTDFPSKQDLAGESQFRGLRMGR